MGSRMIFQENMQLIEIDRSPDKKGPARGRTQAANVLKTIKTHLNASISSGGRAIVLLALPPDVSVKC